MAVARPSRGALTLGAAGAAMLLVGVAASWVVRRLNDRADVIAVTGTIEALRGAGGGKNTGRGGRRAARGDRGGGGPGGAGAGAARRPPRRLARAGARAGGGRPAERDRGARVEPARARAGAGAVREGPHLAPGGGPRPQRLRRGRGERGVGPRAGARLAETRLVSPLTGLVLRKNLEVGETANPGVAILTLMDPTDMWLRADVAETDLGRVRPGQP